MQVNEFAAVFFLLMHSRVRCGEKKSQIILFLDITLFTDTHAFRDNSCGTITSVTLAVYGYISMEEKKKVVNKRRKSHKLFGNSNKTGDKEEEMRLPARKYKRHQTSYTYSSFHKQGFFYEPLSLTSNFRPHHTHTGWRERVVYLYEEKPARHTWKQGAHLKLAFFFKDHQLFVVCPDVILQGCIIAQESCCPVCVYI